MKQNLQPPATPLEMLSLFFPAKAFRASFRGVVDKRFFLYRLAKVYA